MSQDQRKTQATCFDLITRGGSGLTVLDQRVEDAAIAATVAAAIRGHVVETQGGLVLLRAIRAASAAVA